MEFLPYLALLTLVLEHSMNLFIELCEFGLDFFRQEELAEVEDVLD